MFLPIKRFRSPIPVKPATHSVTFRPPVTLTLVEVGVQVVQRWIPAGALGTGNSSSSGN